MRDFITMRRVLGNENLGPGMTLPARLDKTKLSFTNRPLSPVSSEHGHRLVGERGKRDVGGKSTDRPKIGCLRTSCGSQDDLALFTRH